MVSLRQLPKMRGAVLWEGESLKDGKPLVAIATLKSANTKTGNMVQTWILRSDMNPVEARYTGEDISICGDCTHRVNQSCYVNVGQAPNQIYKTYKEGKYPHVDSKDMEILTRFRSVRLGAYGDPAFVPTNIWRDLLKASRGHTGYTHQWKEKFIDTSIKKYVMASVDNLREYQQAKKEGWRTFRVRKRGEENLGTEISCLATEEGGFKSNCEFCLLCSGAKKNKKAKDITVVVHGSRASNFAG